jgi:hypothetical protein
VSTDELLAILEHRHLEVLVDADGIPRLKGDRSEASAKLLRVLKMDCHREEIIRRLRPIPARRVVLLTGERDSAVERVLEECPPEGHHGPGRRRTAMKRRRLPRLSHERAVHVFGFLADFAEAYPRLVEGDQKMYRDLARAALACLSDEQACLEMSVDPAIEQVIAPMVRAQLIERRQKT